MAKRPIAKTVRTRSVRAKTARPTTSQPPSGGVARQSRAELTDQYRALRRRALRIVQGLQGADRRGTRLAATAWEELLGELRAWRRRNRVKVVTQAVKSPPPPDGMRRPGTSPDGHEALMGGAMANGQTLECILRRYDDRRGECVYDCVVFDRNGWIVT